MSVRRAMFLGIWGTAAVVLVVGVVLWTMWKAAAPPSPAEIEAFVSSGDTSAMGDTSAIINGWEVSAGPRTEELVTDGGDRSFMETWILTPVSPMAKLRSWLLLGATGLWFTARSYPGFAVAAVLALVWVAVRARRRRLRRT